MQTKTKSAKYAGADWLRESKKINLSDFGSTVADIVGQVEQGIYHIGDCLNYKGTDWTSDRSIQLPIWGDLATFDFNRLTSLALCCAAAKVQVSISGFSRSDMRLTFTNETSAVFSRPESFINDFADSYTVATIARSYCGDRLDDSNLKVAQGYVKELKWWDLCFLVQASHNNCIRSSVRARSNRSITLMFHQRDRDGFLYERHPTMEDAIKTLKPIWNVLSEERDRCN